MSRFADYFRGVQMGWQEGRPLWETLAPLRYQSDRLGATLIIPAEFITDLASVPRWPLLWWAAGARGTRSAVIHDFAYQFGFWWFLNGARWWQQYVERATADEIFWESLIADPIAGVTRWRAWQMWAAVRMGGRGIWTNQERRSDLNPIWSGGGWEAP